MRVVAADIDRLGHVNNAVYLRWIEQAVYSDWTVRAEAAEFAAFDWIAVRHELDYRRPAFLDEDVCVAVRLVEVRRARAWYDIIVSRSGTVLVEARSCWCCIDSTTRRLTVIPQATASRMLDPV